MSSLIVRNLDIEIVQALKKRAADNGRSTEAEHREILRTMLLCPQKRAFTDVLTDMPDVGLDSDFERQHDIEDSDVFD